MSDDIWPAHSQLTVLAVSLLYPDVVGHSIVFTEASPNLLSAHVDVEACKIDKHGLDSESIESLDDLEFYFETSKSCHTASQEQDLYPELYLPSEDSSTGSEDDHGAEAEIFLIHQISPQSRLAASEEVIKCLLSRHNVFSPFANTISSFSTRTISYYEGSTGFYASAVTQNPGEQSIDELCYVLKYAEQNVDGSLWSIRQMAIYQKADSKTQESKCIIIQPSAEVRRRKEEVTHDTFACLQLSEHWTGLHMLILGPLNRNWTLYLENLDAEVDRLQKPLYTTVVSKVSIKDVQEISMYTERILKYIHTQKLNMEVLCKLREESRRPGGREEFDKKDFSCKYRALEWAIESTLSETKILSSHAELILNRANNAIALLRDLITAQNNQAIQDFARTTTHTLHNFNRNTIFEHNILPNLSQSSIPDSSQEPQSSKTITLIILLFLPLIFTSTFLSMGFIHVTSAQDGLTVQADDGLWFYLALTLPLAVVSFAAWWVWEWRVRRRRRLRDLEGNVKLE